MFFPSAKYKFSLIDSRDLGKENTCLRRKISTGLQRIVCHWSQSYYLIIIIL